MNCDDIGSQLDQLEQLREEIERKLTDAQAVKGLAREFGVATPRSKPKTLRTYTGDKIEVNPADWWQRAERLSVEMGADAIRQMVSVREQKLIKPDGSKGQMINYKMLAYAPENQKVLLELMGAERRKTKKGVMLTQSFTEAVAAQELIAAAKKYGSNPRELADRLGRDLKRIDELPVNMVLTLRGRMETSAELAQQLDDINNLISSGVEITPEMKLQVANTVRWAMWYEQMDAALSRRVGQALRARQFGTAWSAATTPAKLKELSADLLELGKDLDVEKPQPGSLWAQVIESIENGDKKQLKKLATAQRLGASGVDMNRSNFLTELEILNTYRKDNLFSSVWTWGVRNPASLLTQVVYMGEDIIGSSLRLAANGQNPLEAYNAVTTAGRWTMQGSLQAFRNARDHFTHGKQTFASRSMFEEASRELGYEQVGSLEKAKNDAALNKAFEDLTTGYNPLTKGVAFFNLMNASFRKVIGDKILEKTGSDAAYYASFRALGSFDEVVKKTAFDWKTSHENYMRALMEAKDMKFSNRADRIAWIEQTAEARTREAVFSGVMTDDQLASLRRQKVGMPAGTGMDNDTLRLKIFNDLKGTPRLEDEVGAIGAQRADDVTFTGSFDDPATKDILNGVQLMRQNPAAAWVLPVFRTPINGVGWLLNRDPLIATAKWAVAELRNFKGGPLSPAEMADVRARVMVSWGIMLGANFLYSQGLMQGSQGFIRDQQDREKALARAYSFGVPGLAGKYVWWLKGQSIDLFDLMFLQADLARARHEGSLGEQDWAGAMGQMAKAYAQTLRSKSSLASIEQVFKVFENPEYGVQDLIGSQLSGITPLSGLQGNLVRTIQSDPNSMRVPRDARYLSDKEAALLDKDELAPILRPVVDILQRAMSNTLLGLIPGASPAREKDWRGNRRRLPLDLGFDTTGPFTAVGYPNDKNLEWEVEHGFGEMPRANRSAVSFVSGMVPSSMRDQVPDELTMNDAEYDSYRVGFREEVGAANSEQLLKGALKNSRVVTELGGLDQYVNGNDFQGAITALRTDPRYAEMLESDSRLNPSRQRKPFDTLKNRLVEAKEDLTGTNAYDPIRLIYAYYDILGMQRMARENPGFAQRVAAMGQRQVEEGLGSAGAFWGLGPR